MASSGGSALPAPFLDAFQFFNGTMRRGGTGGVGLYYDKYIMAGGTSDISIGSTGFGMVSVCIGDALGLIQRENAIKMTIETLDTLLGARRAEGFNPERSVNGFFAHFLNPETGKASPGSEISTIDTALMAAGALFARNYLKDPIVVEKTNQLVRGIAWGDAIVDPEGRKIYMIIDKNTGAGDPNPSTWTSPFNEYFLVARVGYVVEQEMKRPGNASRYFDNIYGNLPQSFEQDGAVKLIYWMFGPLWSDRQGHFGSSFIVQFCYYLSSFFQTHCSDFFNQAAAADWLYFRNEFNNSQGPPHTKDSKYQWGCGAGAYPGGYYATAIGDNSQAVYSPPIIAGFFPAEEFIQQQAPAFVAISETLEYFYGNEVCTYEVEGKRLIWRRSLMQPEWRAPTIESVDFSTFLLGYGWKLAGKEFFMNNAI